MADFEPISTTPIEADEAFVPVSDEPVDEPFEPISSEPIKEKMKPETRAAIADAIAGVIGLAAPQVPATFTKAALTKGGAVGDLAAGIVLPMAGSVISTGAGLSPVPGAAGGAAYADMLVQTRRMLRGEQDKFSVGSLVGNTAVGAFVPKPLQATGSLARDLAKTGVARGVQGLGLGAAQSAIAQTIDPEPFSWERLAADTAMGGLFGAAFGGVEALTPAVSRGYAQFKGEFQRQKSIVAQADAAANATTMTEATNAANDIAMGRTPGEPPATNPEGPDIDYTSQKEINEAITTGGKTMPEPVAEMPFEVTVDSLEADKRMKGLMEFRTGSGRVPRQTPKRSDIVATIERELGIGQRPRPAIESADFQDTVLSEAERRGRIDLTPEELAALDTKPTPESTKSELDIFRETSGTVARPTPGRSSVAAKIERSVGIGGKRPKSAQESAEYRQEIEAAAARRNEIESANKAVDEAIGVMNPETVPTKQDADKTLLAWMLKAEEGKGRFGSESAGTPSTTTPAAQTGGMPVIKVDSPSMPASQTRLAEIIHDSTGAKIPGVQEVAKVGPSIDDVVGKKVRYEGYEGTMTKDSEGRYAVLLDVAQKGKPKLIEIADVGKNPSKPIAELGIEAPPDLPKPTPRDEMIRKLGALASSRLPSVGEPLAGAIIGDVSARALGKDEETIKDWRTKGFQIGAAVSIGGSMAGSGKVRLTKAGLQNLDAIAYHGSRHKFNKFSSDKVGAGEGYQTYGHGLYFAESPSVADTYRTAGSSEEMTKGIFIGNRRVDDTGSATIRSMTPLKWASVLARSKGLQEARETLAEIVSRPEGDTSGDAKALEIVEGWIKRNASVKDTGNMYRVDLDLPDDAVLHFDEQLSQHPAVFKTLSEKLPEVDLGLWEIVRKDGRTQSVTDSIETANAAVSNPHADGLKYRPLRITMERLGITPDFKDASGKEVYDSLAAELARIGRWADKPFARNPERKASEILDSIGIRGVKYADQFSRGKPKIEVIGGSEYEARRLAEEPGYKSKADWSKRHFVVEKGTTNTVGEKIGGDKLQYDTAVYGYRDKASAEAFASKNNPTHNYVVFNDKNIRIVDRNGDPVPSGPEDIRKMGDSFTGKKSGELGTRGAINPALMFQLGQASAPVAAGMVGYQFGDTPEEKRQNAIMAALFAGGGILATKAAVHLVKKNRPLYNALVSAARAAANEDSLHPMNHPDWNTPRWKVPEQSPNAEIRVAAQDAPSTTLANPLPRYSWSPGLSKIKAFGALKKLVGAVEDNIMAVNKRVAGVLRSMDGEIDNMRVRWKDGTEGFGKLSRRTMTPEDFSDLDYAVWGGDDAAIRNIISKYPNNQELLEAYGKFRTTYEEMAVSQEAVGRKIARIQNAAPRKIIDYDELRAALGREEAGVLDMALETAEKTKGHPLTSQEREDIINATLSMTFKGKPGHLKDRTIYELPKEVVQKHYEPFDVAMDDRIARVSRDVANRKYLGHNSPEDPKLWDGKGGTLGQVILEEMNEATAKADLINFHGQKEILQNLRDRFGAESHAEDFVIEMGNKISRANNFLFLGDLVTSLAQFGDIFVNLWRFGLGATAKGYKGVLSRGGDHTRLKDLGLGDTFSETQSFSRGAGNTKFRRFADGVVSKMVGMADTVNKEATINSARHKFLTALKDETSSDFIDFNRKYSQMYPERWPDILKDLRSADFSKGKLNDNTRFFLYNELADLQPITMSQRAQFENASPGARFLYSLRRYFVKQLNVMRTNGYEKMKRPESFVDGAKNIAAYLAVVSLGQGLAIGTARDIIMGRDVDLVENAAEGVAQSVGINRYMAENLKQKGFGAALGSYLFPLASVGDDVIRDYSALVNHEKELHQLRTLRYTPVAGRLYNAYFGSGADAKAEEARKKKRRVRQADLPPTLQSMSDLLVPIKDKR